MRWVIVLLLGLGGCSHKHPTQSEKLVVTKCHTVINGVIYFYECGTTPPTEIDILMEDKQ